MTLQGRSPGLRAALEERDNLKIQMNLLRESGGSADAILATGTRLVQINEEIRQLRQSLVAEPITRKRRVPV